MSKHLPAPALSQFRVFPFTDFLFPRVLCRMPKNRGENDRHRKPQRARPIAGTAPGRPLPPAKSVPTSSRDLQRLFSGIGAPEPAPFKPDTFQLEALAALEFED